MTQMSHEVSQTDLDRIKTKIVQSYPCEIFHGRITYADDELELEEQQCLVTGLRGKTWCDVTPEFIQQNPDGYVHLTDEAFPFYFPAWLTSSLENDETREFLAYTFSPPQGTLAGLTDSTERRILTLTQSQRHVLLDALEVHRVIETSDCIKEHVKRAFESISHFAASNNRLK